MNVKKDVFVSIQKKLRKEQGNLRYKIEGNKISMKNLAYDQTKYKRELAELEKLIKSLDT